MNFSWLNVLIGIGAGALLMLIIKLTGFSRYVANDHIGILEKIWSSRGSVRHGFIALHKEAGYQPDILRGGIHLFPPFVYKVHRADLVTIPTGTMAYVYARDGESLPATQTLAHNEDKDDFTDARSFLERGGQKGVQRKILREGTYAINLVQFAILAIDGIHAINLSKHEAELLDGMHEVLVNCGGYHPVVIGDDRMVSVGRDVIGIVTVHDGPSLPSGEIVASEVQGHSSFQTPDVFLVAGGCRGRQLQTIVDGTYYINRLFATVEVIDKTLIEIGHVGVVVSFTGAIGADTSGEAYRHGTLVEVGKRGVWKDALLPGKYAFNTYAGSVEQVPTVNLVLKWQRGVAGQFGFDEKLSEISLITKDCFEPLLPLSVVLHIPYDKAPELIQRFGNVKRLVEATLDPMITSYFKNLAQKMTLIELIQERDKIQAQATSDMKERFAAYSLVFHEVLIGTPRANESDATLETILVQLRQRQVAIEQKTTYDLQEKAAVQERALNEARAIAERQTVLTASSIQIKIRENEGAADLAKAVQDAEKIRTLAHAEATRIYVEGEATAKAAVLQRDAYGGPDYRLALEVIDRFCTALREGKQAVVPQIVVGGSEQGGAGSVGAILSGMLAAGMLVRQHPEQIP